MPVSQPQSKNDRFTSSFRPFIDAIEYAIDGTQRGILFWDVMRQRGNAYREHLAETAPHVLEYAIERN
jgi:hypothetical protein